MHQGEGKEEMQRTEEGALPEEEEGLVQDRDGWRTRAALLERRANSVCVGADLICVLLLWRALSVTDGTQILLPLRT